jgi:molybdate transport system permease protein
MAPIDPSPLLLSLATTVTATAVTFFLGLLAAWRMMRVGGRWRGWLDGVLTLPLILPPTVVGYFLLLVFGRQSPIGQLLASVGITIIFSWPATVIAAAVVAFPLMYRTTLGAFEQVNPALLDAARTLGASERRVFGTILVPLAAPGILAGTVLAFARAMGEFGATLMLAGNIPGHTQTMPIAIFSAVEGGDERIAAVWVAAIVVISFGMIRLMHVGPAGLFRAREAAMETAQLDDVIARGHGGELGELVSPAGSAERASLSPDRTSLSVDVQKSLPSFELCICLSAGREAMGLLGASGAGKSITLRMIAGLVRPDSGRIEVNGRALFDSRRGIDVAVAARRIGVVFQDYALFPHLTVFENVAYPLHGLPRGERTERVEQLLRALHVGHLAASRPGAISGGERQRVAIARCLAMNPEALLFDEPFAALDPHLRRATEEQLRETLRFYRGAVLFVTHDMEEAFRFCSGLVVLDRGRVIASGPRQQLFDNPQSVVAARLTGCKNIVAAERVDSSSLRVDAWECVLRTAAPGAEKIVAVGYRSHQFRFGEQAVGENVFNCWLVEQSEAPHEMTLYLRLHGAPVAGDAAHLQADLPKAAWQLLQQQPQPWKIQLAPERLLLLGA